MVDTVPEKLWTEVCNIVQEAVTNIILKKKKFKKAKWLSARPYKLLRKEEKQKAIVKGKDLPIWIQSSKEYKER